MLSSNSIENDNMPQKTSTVSAETHQVFNQVPALENYNLYQQDQALKEALHREGGAWGEEKVSALGDILGQTAWIERGFQANKVLPEFHSHDRFGHRQDKVDFHPAYHELMSLATEQGIQSLPWNTPKPGAHVVRMAMNFTIKMNLVLPAL